MCDTPRCENAGIRQMDSGKWICQKHWDEKMWFKNQLQTEAAKQDDIDFDCGRCGKEMEYGEMQDINGNKTHLECECGNKRKIGRN